jgi:probable HAF family extracellular repeat protein
MQDLGGFLTSIGYGNNDCNAVAGAAQSPTGWTAAYWPAFAVDPASSLNDLGNLWGVFRVGAESFAWDVNNRNQVALELPLPTANQTTAATWSPYFSFTEIGRLPGHTRAAARAINDAGLVVGNSSSGSTVRGFAWTAQDGIVDLGTRLDPALGAGGWTILRANAVSENGHIVAVATRPGLPSSGVAVLLSPVQCAGFLDVPAASPFCSSVEWMKARSITLGCGNGNYCPDADVTRLAMAAFMQRLGDTMSGQAIVESDLPGPLDLAEAPVVCTTDTIAPSTAPRRAVVDAWFSAITGTESTGFARVVVSQDRGVSWQELGTNHPRNTFPELEWRSVRALGHYDMPAHHELRFGLRVDRGTSTDPSSVTGSACRLRLRIDNGFDPAL